MNAWIFLLLLGFARDIPSLVHEVMARSITPTTSRSVRSSLAITNDIESSGTTINISSSDAPNNETTSVATSVSPSPTRSSLITSSSIQTSSIATGSEATTMITGSREPHTSQETSPTSPSTAAAAQVSKEPPLSQNPGLVAVICIFVAVLFIAGVVVLVKFCHRREPAFKKLDEVPMGKVAEDSPFARYPPK